jgi:hypothetical protein
LCQCRCRSRSAAPVADWEFKRNLVAVSRGRSEQPSQLFTRTDCVLRAGNLHSGVGIKRLLTSLFKLAPVVNVCHAGGKFSACLGGTLDPLHVPASLSCGDRFEIGAFGVCRQLRRSECGLQVRLLEAALLYAGAQGNRQKA